MKKYTHNEAMLMDISNIENKNVLIIGCPGFGKTYLSNIIKSNKHQIFHTDDYIKHGLC